MELFYFEPDSRFSECALLYPEDQIEIEELKGLIVALEKSPENTLQANPDLTLLESATKFDDVIIRADNISIQTLIRRALVYDVTSNKSTEFLGVPKVELQSGWANSRPVMLAAPFGGVSTISLRLVGAHVEHPVFRAGSITGSPLDTYRTEREIFLSTYLPMEIFTNLYQSPHYLKEIELTFRRGSNQPWFMRYSNLNTGVKSVAEIMLTDPTSACRHSSKTTVSKLRKLEIECSFEVKVKQ